MNRIVALAGLLVIIGFIPLSSVVNAADPVTDPALAKQLEELDQVVAQGPWRPDWDSLTTHEIPEWFQDAKFGIYAHLGVYCVPAYGTEWYPRKMYQKGDAVYKYHVETYGDPSEFGYKDFVPRFTLDKFDAAEWADLYQQAGARFAGPVAEHHDGFSMWASQVNRWNVGNTGPKRDIAGELIRELRKRELRIITSFHHAFNIQGYYTPSEGWDTADPQFGDLYGFPTMEDRTLALDRWLIKLKEVVDAYQPDQIWFDFGLARIPEEYKQRFAAYYYNHETTWNKPVIITRKGNHLPDGVGVLDIERGRMKDTGRELWQTDDSTAYNSWSWVDGLRVKPTKEMVHELIDIVSKNGVLLLNVCPTADGTISPDQQRMLRELGQWLEINGEAIYGTRSWKIMGEGPTRMEKGGSFLKTITYTSRDIRYTRSKDGRTLYAICLGWPASSVSLRYVQVQSFAANASVTMLGYDKPLLFDVDADGQLEIQIPSLTPEDRPCDHAFALRLSGFDTALSRAARYALPDAISLTADQAVLEGEKIHTETKTDRTSIGFWDDANERVHWLVRVTREGRYGVAGEFAVASGVSPLAVEVAGQTIDFSVPATGGWNSPKLVHIGEIQFDKPGVYHLILRAGDNESWKAANVWKLEMAPQP